MHVLWECSAYNSIFVESLEKLLEENFVGFSALDGFSRTGFIL